jgi:hypothetical protein
MDSPHPPSWPEAERSSNWKRTTWSRAPIRGFCALQGFLIEAIREPLPDDAVVAKHPEEERWRRIPNFLMVRACLK